MGSLAAKPRVLCVDDEPSVLEGLALTLRRGYDVTACRSGQAGLDFLASNPGIAVVISDMRMPGMDGATFLSRARAILPDATRVLLTGQADLSSAIAAINEGQIFRFLNKPCPPPVFLAAVEAAFEMHRLITSERVLLEQTLRGSIQMLAEVLALAAPAAFGQAMRIQRRARELGLKAAVAEIWPIEVAAMISQIGFVTLAPSTLDKLQEGISLTPAEQAALDRSPALAEKLIASIPRLDAVRAVLKQQGAAFDGTGALAAAPHGKDLPAGARILAIVCDYDRLEATGMTPPLALRTMRGRRGKYDPDLLELFAAQLGTQGGDEEVTELPMRMVRVGMTFVEDVRTNAGMLLVARGHEATASLVERFLNYAPGSVREPVRVSIKRAPRTTS